MSFFKDVFNDFTRFDTVINTEAIRLQAKGFLIGGIGLLAMFLADALLFNTEIPLHVHSYLKGEMRIAELSSAFGTISPDNQVILNYEPATLVDAVLFNSMGALNLADFLFFLYIGMLLFKTLRTVDDQSTFRRQISKMYKKIAAGCFWMYAIKILYNGFFLYFLLDYRTHHQFSLASAPGQSASYFIYLFFGGIILSFVYFSNKGEALQQEQDLTI